MDIGGLTAFSKEDLEIKQRDCNKIRNVIESIIQEKKLPRKYNRYTNSLSVKDFILQTPRKRDIRGSYRNQRRNCKIGALSSTKRSLWSIQDTPANFGNVLVAGAFAGCTELHQKLRNVCTNQP